MDIEQLNKSQIILLTLLISFITSIATGIVTVTLMDQAPEGVSRTITHVVERTVEQVRPKETQVATVIKEVEVPVIVTEEELVLKAIDKVSPAVGLLRAESTSREAGVTLGTAWLADVAGHFMTAGSLVKDKGRYEVVMESGEIRLLTVTRFSAGGEVAVLSPKAGSVGETAEPSIAVVPLELGKSDTAVGQTVISFGATVRGNHRVAIGIVADLFAGTGSQTGSTTIISTNAASADNVGGPLVYISGQVIGLSLEPGVAVGKKVITSTIDSIN